MRQNSILPRAFLLFFSFLLCGKRKNHVGDASSFGVGIVAAFRPAVISGGCGGQRLITSSVLGDGRFRQRPTNASLNIDRIRRLDSSSSSSSSSDVFFEDAEDEEEEIVEPGEMRVSEIKAELDLREVSYADCFDKESLVQKLREARETGKADPKILEKFNKQKLEESFKGEKLEVDDDDIEKAVANDGTLPGGMTPEQFKKLAGNPEIMALLQSTKMQTAMQIMMTGGPEELERKIKDDPELEETVKKLDEVLKGAQ